MNHAFICDAIRTPFGRYGGALSSVRTDDLGALPIQALMQRNPNVDWARGRRRDLRLRQPGRRGQPQRRAHGRAAGRPAGRGAGRDDQPPVRLGHGRAWARAARAIRCGEAELMIAGGVESMSRAPFVMPKAETAFCRSNAVYDTTIGWRFVNKLMKERYGVDSMPETAENVAARVRHRARRAGPDGAARRSSKAVAAQQARLLRRRDRAGDASPQKKGEPIVVAQGRASARDQPGGAGQAEGHRAARRHGDRRQRHRRQRRRLRAAAGQRSRGRSATA